MKPHSVKLRGSGATSYPHPNGCPQLLWGVGCGGLARSGDAPGRTWRMRGDGVEEGVRKRVFSAEEQRVQRRGAGPREAFVARAR